MAITQITAYDPITDTSFVEVDQHLLYRINYTPESLGSNPVDLFRISCLN